MSAEDKEKEKIEQEEIKQEEEAKFNNNYLSESYTKKFIKTGLLAIGSAILFKGKNNELLRAGATTAATLALSEDEDYSKDAIVLASLFGVKNASKLAKFAILSDPEKFKKAYSYAEKADVLSKRFNLAMINLTAKASETYSKNLQKFKLANPVQDNASISSKTFNFFRTHASSIYGTAKDSISFLYKNGISESLDNISNNSFYNNYKKVYENIDLKKIEIMANDLKEKFGLNIKDMEVKLASRNFDYLLNVFVPDQLFTSKQEQYQKAAEIFKKIKKYQRIEESTFFTDMFGMYSKMEDGKVVLRMDKILEDRMHFADSLNTLAEDFENELKKDYPNRASRLSKETKVSLFLDYLKRNGFQEVIDKAYKKDDLISFKEVNEMINKKTNGIGEFMAFGKKSQLNFVNDLDDDVKEVKHLDLLENFAFTNVVRKTSNGFFDETALNGHINFLKTLGVLEKNFVGTFKIPILDKTWNTWNPFKLIESDARIKNELVNNVLGLHYNEKGYVVNGMHIGVERKRHKIYYRKRNGEQGVRFGPPIATYTIDPRRDAKVVFNKNLLSITNEEFSVSKATKKDGSITYTSLWNTFKEKNGFKKALSQFSYSFMNPFSFRIDYNPSGKLSFKSVKTSDAYFKDGTFFTQYINKADIDVSKMRAENDLIEKYIKEIKLGASKSVLGLLDDEDRAFVNKKLINFLTGKMKKFDLPKGNPIFNRLVYQIQNNLLDSDKMDTATKYQKLITTLVGFKNKGKITDEEFGILNNYFDYGLALTAARKGELEKAIEFTGSAKEFFAVSVGKKGSPLNKAVASMAKGLPTEDMRKFFTQTLNIINDYEKSMKKINKHMNNLLHKDSIGRKNYVDEYLNLFGFDNKDSVFNPVYEILKGKELNTITKKYFDENYISISEKINFITSKKEAPDYANTTFASIVQEVKKMFGFNKETKVYNSSYKIFDKIESTMRENYMLGKNNPNVDEINNRINNKTFDQLVEEYNQLKYEKNEGRNVTATIIREREINYKNVKDILNKVKVSIYNLMSENKDNNKELETKMNLLSKIAIAKLQDALEYVGVERLTQDKLGHNGLGQIYNFMKYRTAPLFLIGSGVMAADTLSDALVPDDVPIIGNGVSGVAVKGVAASRIGLQYMLQGTGILSIMRGMENAIPGLFNNALGDSLDILMSPSEMIDVYFRGKPIEVKDNRWWFTAGRQSGQGEEFRQYRPHLWYIWQNKDAGIYSSKFEKLFRRDFVFTKYPWYLLDPYKEEREAYEKYGAVYPMTEQLFKEIPVIGHFLNATIGEVIKPTQLIGEDKWLVGDNMMRNPNYDPNDSSSPKYIKFSRPNKLIQSVFEAVEDLKTFSGIQGYAATKITEALFGSTNPYQNEVKLSSIDENIGMYARYDRLQLGDLFGMTEPIRRLVDKGDSLGMISMNPLEQKLPDWLPDYFKKGNNPYLTWDFGNYILPGREFDRSSNNNSENGDLNKFRVLALAAPSSRNFKELKSSLYEQIDNFSKEEQKHYYESLSYAEHYGERDYLNKYHGKAPDIENISLTIDKKISPYEFISNGKRYKLDSVTDDFNMLTERYGSSKATKMINELNNMFLEGQTYSFRMSQDASYSVGIDDEGDYFKIDSDEISNKYNLEHSGYRRQGIFSKMLSKNPLSLIQNSPVNIGLEKIFGVKDVYNEWSAETVQSPFFRDWDAPVSSFLEPFYTFSSNSITSALDFSRYSNSIYLNSNATFNVLGNLNKLGMLKLPFNKLLGNVTKSKQYEEETRVHDELEKIKFVAGDKSFYNMTGKENIRQFSNMVNEQDAEFLEDLANVSNKKEREKILNGSNERLAAVLKTIWNRHQMSVDNTVTYENIEQPTFDQVLDVGGYYGNAEETRNMLKSTLGINLSKLDIKRQGVFNAYRGSAASREAQFIHNRMYKQYNSSSNVISTIYGHGVININKRKGERY